MSRVGVNVKIEKEQKEWMDEMINQQYFASYSHAVRFIIQSFRRIKGIV